MEHQLLEILKKSIRDQFGASIDMLENVVQTCPDSLWEKEKGFSNLTYHTLFFLDYYLTLQPVGFAAPDSFQHSEFEDNPPQEIFPKPEILNYLQSCKTKLGNLLSNFTEDLAQSRWINESKTMDFSLIEILLYSLRHVQHHVGQLNRMLRQSGIEAPDWVYRGKWENKL